MSKKYLETPFRDIGKETGSKMREADIQLLILSMHTNIKHLQSSLRILWSKPNTCTRDIMMNCSVPYELWSAPHKIIWLYVSITMWPPSGLLWKARYSLILIILNLFIGGVKTWYRWIESESTLNSSLICIVLIKVASLSFHFLGF